MRKNKNGFTLIELIAVIIVLGIIAFIAIVVVGNVVDDFRKNAYKTSIMHLFNAVETYTYINGNSELIKGGIEVKKVNTLDKNPFKTGIIFLNNKGNYEISDVSDGNYCASGELDKINIIKGACDNELPTIELTVNGNSVTIRMTDNKELAGYMCINEDDEPTTWNKISGKDVTKTCTIDNTKTYYVWVKDTAENKTSLLVPDVEKPTISTSLNKNVVTINVTDNKELSGYACISNKNEPTTWTEMSGKESTVTCTFDIPDIYYIWVKDTSNNKNSTSIVVPDTDKPTVSATLSDNVATIKMTDNKELSGYACVSGTNEPTTWTAVSGKDVTKTCAFSTPDTYYIWVKDTSNNKNKTSVIVPDNDKPTFSTTVSKNVVTIKMADNKELAGYACVSGTSEPTAWTAVSGKESTVTCTFNTPDTYYIWVKDTSNNKTNKQLVIGKENFCDYAVGYSWTYNYNGGVQTFTTPCNGTYKLEAWGAQGGLCSAYGNGVGGKGGYSYGNKDLNTGTKVYVAVGGQGGTSISTNNSNAIAGGYNGGGSGGNRNGNNNGGVGAGSGGGATHMAINNNRGVLSSYASYKNEILLIAGGGGGGTVYGYWDSNKGYNNYSYAGGNGNDSATTSTFGIGTGCGGGGYYGGRGLGYMSFACGGGTGYVGGVVSGGMTAGSRTGHGTAKITLIALK